MANGNLGGAAAYQRLQPRKPIKIGAIVEEQIRYWRKYDDAKDAAEKARKAKEVEALGKKNKESWKLFPPLNAEQNKGFLNSQIVDVVQRNKSKWAEISKKARNGDVEAQQKYNNIKYKLGELVKVNKAYGIKATELAKQKAEGNYNEYIDKPIDDFGSSLGRGLYKVNDDLGMDMYDPTSGEVKKVPNGSLFSNEYLNASYNKKPQFQTNGPLIAKTLLDTADGEKLIDSNTRVKGIQLVKNLFAQDPTEALSWYSKNMQDEGVDSYKQKPFSELTEMEASVIAADYYDKNVLPRIQEVTKDTSLDDANKRAALTNKRLEAQKKRLAIKKGKKAARKGSSMITVATDEQGDILKGLKSEYESLVVSDDAEVYTVGNNGVSLKEVKGDKKTETTLKNLVIEEGRVIGLANRVDKVPIEGSDGKFKDVVVEEVITDKNILNKFATLIDKEDGTPNKNLKELSETMEKARAEVAPVENKPTESKEARIARMRAAIKGN